MSGLHWPSAGTGRRRSGPPPAAARPPRRAMGRCLGRVAERRVDADRDRPPVTGATLERRLANYRATLSASSSDPGDRRGGGVGRGSVELGVRLAAAVDGELLLDPAGPVVRCEPAT